MMSIYSTKRLLLANDLEPLRLGTELSPEVARCNMPVSQSGPSSQNQIAAFYLPLAQSLAAPKPRRSIGNRQIHTVCMKLNYRVCRESYTK